jgi:FeS assembly SUF system protein
MSNQKIIEILKTVFDPEIPVNIYDLGLIYKITVNSDSSVSIDMTLTSPACPLAGSIVEEVKSKVSQLDGISEVMVNLVFEPTWDMSMMSEEAKLELGFM